MGFRRETRCPHLSCRVRVGNGNFRSHLAATRNTQLDGWRAFAVAGVMWYHWAPREWRGPFPFEIGLFFFLTLTGFLITRILLRERAAGEAGGGPLARRGPTGDSNSGGWRGF